MKTPKKEIVVSFQFTAFHYWDNAPEKYEFLHNPHRHVFHVRATKTVAHNDRDIEFIQLKEQMHVHCFNRYTKGTTQDDPDSSSCEDIAERLMKMYHLQSCEVLEDGENGARLFYEEGAKEKEPEKHKEIRTYPFVGTEAEGPPFLRGRPTLFLPMTTMKNFDRSQELIKNYTSFALYLGAGNDVVTYGVDYCIDLLIVSERTKTQTYTPIIEIESLAELLRHPRIEVLMQYELVVVARLIKHKDIKAWRNTSPNLARLFRPFQKKVTPTTVSWLDMSTKEISSTELSDPLFKKDERVNV